MNNILIVFHSGNIQSGATRSLTDIVMHLKKTNKYHIEVAFPEESGSALEYYKSLGIEVHSYTYGKLMQNLTQPLLKRVIKEPLLLARYFKIKSEASRAVVELQNKKFDLVYSNTSSIIFGGLLGLKLGIKQAWHIREFRIKDHQIRFFLGEKYLKKLINKCSDVVFFVSESVMKENLDIIDREKCIVTYNSYSENFICPKESFNYSNKIDILLAGDIKPSKGQFIAVQAIKLLKERSTGIEYILHLAGRNSNNNYYNNILNFIKSNNLINDVVLHGQVTDMFSLRKKMDIGIVSSTNEAFGRTTIEGMLSMIAMIGRNSGGTVEQIKNLKTGLLYDGSVEDLADKIEYYGTHREKMENISRTAFDECVQLHTKGRCANLVEEALDRVLNASE